MLAWKLSNNGTTFVASSYRLPWLDKSADELFDEADTDAWAWLDEMKALLRRFPPGTHGAKRCRRPRLALREPRGAFSQTAGKVCARHVTGTELRATTGCRLRERGRDGTGGCCKRGRSSYGFGVRVCVRDMRDDGEEKKQVAMRRAAHPADPRWWASMFECGKLIAQRKLYFTTDDVVLLCFSRYPDGSTRERRAIGPLMLALSAMGYCRPTQKWTQSTQRQCHRRPMMVWRSLLFKT
jgi:hypothetical protein